MDKLITLCAKVTMSARCKSKVVTTYMISEIDTYISSLLSGSYGDLATSPHLMYDYFNREVHTYPANSPFYELCNVLHLMDKEPQETLKAILQKALDSGMVKATKGNGIERLLCRTLPERGIILDTQKLEVSDVDDHEVGAKT